MAAKNKKAAAKAAKEAVQFEKKRVAAEKRAATKAAADEKKSEAEARKVLDKVKLNRCFLNLANFGGHVFTIAHRYLLTAQNMVYSKYLEEVNQGLPSFQQGRHHN